VSGSTRLGAFDLTIVSDGTYFLDGGNFFGIIPKALWQKRAQPDELNRLVVGLNSVLVRGAGKTVLIETGIGNKLNEKMARNFSPQAKLLENLRAAHCDPAQVDIVINSHLHFDHCGWNTVRDASGKIVPTFPNATYYAPRGEWEAGKLQRERDAVSYISDNYDPLIASGQMKLLEGGETVLPGISVETYPGHTRSMCAAHIESEGKHACYISDLIPTTNHLDLVWGMAFDLFPLETIENKKRFYARAIPEKWTVIFTHDPKIPVAYVERTPEGRLVHSPIIQF
jgi:glyoxylase-like metal-dependent hydrolase (beta-lactamase superfamily II)